MVAALVAVNLFAAPAVTAQVISVPDPTLTAGGSTNIDVMDPANANSTVTVTVENGSETNPESVEIEVQLDGDGVGTATWMVPDSPNWWSAEFRLPGASSQSRFIMPRPKPHEGKPAPSEVR